MKKKYYEMMDYRGNLFIKCYTDEEYRAAMENPRWIASVRYLSRSNTRVLRNCDRMRW